MNMIFFKEKNKLGIYLITLDEYEGLKGEVADKASAFEKGQIVAFAYMADCINASVSFEGMDGVIRKIESGRRLMRSKDRNGGRNDKRNPDKQD